MKIRRIFTDESYQVIIGFGMERIKASENLGQYLQRGEKLTSKMIKDLIAELRNLNHDSDFSHGDLVSKVEEEGIAMYYVNIRNILVVADGDGELTLKLIDHNPGGFFNHPLDSPEEEIQVLERYLNQFLY